MGVETHTFLIYKIANILFTNFIVQCLKFICNDKFLIYPSDLIFEKSLALDYAKAGGDQCVFKRAACPTQYFI